MVFKSHAHLWINKYQWCWNRGGHWPPQYLADQLILLKPGRADYPHLNYYWPPPNFFHLPASTTYILRMSKCKVINKIYIFGNVYYLHFSMDKNLIQIRILQWKSSRILENFSILFWCTFEIFLEIFIHGTCSQIHHYWLQQNFRKRIKH